MACARVHSIETMGALDGPGLRYVLFLQGCPFRCAFCHNPDSWTLSNRRLESADSIFADVKKYVPFFQSSQGGFTVSGGEPMIQAEFLCELFEKLKAENISIAVDTCGGVELSESVKRAIELSDILLIDVKHVDESAHIKLTGQSSELPRRFLSNAASRGKRIWIRQVLLEGITATSQYAHALAQFLKPYEIEKIELLPYHNMAKSKWHALGLKYALENMTPPSSAAIEEVKKILEEAHFKVSAPC